MPGIYLHIPFCRRKCYYCDFYSLGSRNAPWERFADALLDEWNRRRGELPGLTEADSPARGRVDTLYVGGGTPSQMPTPLLERLLGALPEADELTVEVNPEDVTPELVATLRRAGVNRVSMGVQSFVDSELEAIGRRHTADQARRAYALLRHGFGNVSIDLIFGLPGQTQQSWQRSVDEAVALRPEHLSAYSLMWEERSALTRMRQMGKVDEADEMDTEAMYNYLTASLKAAGYEHYEISNYALPGYRSRHNSAYWTGEPYLGLGPGAHSYDGDRVRRSNPADLLGYLEHFGREEREPFYEEERLSDSELREEYIMTRLRRREGIEVADFCNRFGEAEGRELLWAARGAGDLLETGADRIKLSPKGVMLSDSAIVRLL